VIPSGLPVIGPRALEKKDRCEARGRVRLDPVIVPAEHRAPLDAVGRDAGDAAVLRIHPVAVRDEVVLPFLHPEHLGLVAGAVRRQPLDLHRELPGLDCLRQQILDVAELVFELGSPAWNQGDVPDDLADGLAVNERVVELAGLQVSHQLALERPRGAPLRRGRTLHHPHTPVELRRRLQVLIHREAGLPDALRHRLVDHHRERRHEAAGRRREGGVVRHLELVRARARLIRRPVVHGQCGLERPELLVVGWRLERGRNQSWVHNRRRGGRRARAVGAARRGAQRENGGDQPASVLSQGEFLRQG